MREMHVTDFDKWIRTSSIVDYVAQRQNADGGYTFAQWSESSAQDTYYAIEIFKMLGVQPHRRQTTINFLQKLQQADGSFDSIKVAYYVTRSLKRLGTTPRRGVEEYVQQAQDSVQKWLGSVEVNIEASSDMETPFLSLEIFRLLGKPIESGTLPELILNLRNHDGTFGRSGYSRMASVYYALASLKLLGYNVTSLEDTLRWVRACENPAGGFARNPKDFDPYLVLEDTYYGLKALKVLDETCLYPSLNGELIGKFQNGNGGFRRSIFLGISTFEDTFYALTCLRLLKNS